ncbi:DinB family protein [Amycolatopsis australiensis]|uniref:DinB superfamily protein n=1 Tax=Amycolatopsis australiensis TaxID=546364 RepID=A0A1K1SAG3_9PSEU|nr:DinB family protein [Amycolatopsis australiensis]SFW81347.1 Protein of unknown function [Amycolatopsis australiensis]
MTDSDPKADLRRYLQAARDALVWKLDGLSEYDMRRPMTPTGTNLLGLVKHMAGVELGYFGDTFGRKFPESLPWYDNMDDEPGADFWASEDESQDDIVGLYRRVWAFADETIEPNPLDAAGMVPWWPPERRETTLHRVLVHVIAEINRHAGHADIVRELVDGAIGLRADASNLPDLHADSWAEHREKLERVARAAGPVQS